MDRIVRLLLAYGRPVVDHFVPDDLLAATWLIRMNQNTFTIVWGVLVAATLLVYALAETADLGPFAIVGVILIAMIKVRCVFLYFMELKSGAMPWRAVAEVWILLVTLILAGMYLLTPIPTAVSESQSLSTTSEMNTP